MGKCKTIAIQTGLRIFRHIQELFRHIQAYPRPCVTLAYLEPWYIQNPDLFRSRSIFRTLAYSQPCIFRTHIYSERYHIQNPRYIQSPVKHSSYSGGSYSM